MARKRRADAQDLLEIFGGLRYMFVRAVIYAIILVVAITVMPMIANAYGIDLDAVWHGPFGQEKPEVVAERNCMQTCESYGTGYLNCEYENKGCKRCWCLDSEGLPREVAVG